MTRYLKETCLVTCSGQFDSRSYLKKQVNYSEREILHFVSDVNKMKFCDIFKGEIVFKLNSSNSIPQIRSVLNNMTNVDIKNMQILGVASSDVYFDEELKMFPPIVSFEISGMLTIFNTSKELIERGDLIIWKIPHHSTRQTHHYPYIKDRFVIETHPAKNTADFDTSKILGVAQSKGESMKLFDIILTPRFQYILSQIN